MTDTQHRDRATPVDVAPSVSGAGTAAVEPADGPLGVVRSREDRIVAGVAAGVAQRLRLDPLVVRAALVILTFAAGVGLSVYLLLWALLPDAAQPERSQPPAADVRRPIGFALITLGVLVALREIGLWFGDALVWPLALAAVGSTVIWARADVGDRVGLRGLGPRIQNELGADDLATGTSAWRLVVGALLVAAGGGAVLVANASFSTLGHLLLALAVSVVGVAIVVAPWALRLARRASTERRERIRSQERADMAAHLHDSVLQTLALIQRSSTPAEMASLARAQERELRAWLYGQPDSSGAERVEAALTALAAKVESHHNVPVEVVVVGDVPLDEATRAVVLACGEAMTNAAAHSGASRVDVYLEVEPQRMTAYVSDEGRGFDLAAVPPDRRGIAQSIRGRVARHGGTVEITTSPGTGTEVRIEVPRNGKQVS